MPVRNSLHWQRHIQMENENISTSNFIKQTLPDIKGQIGTDTIIMGDYITPLSSIDRSSQQKNPQRNFRVKLNHRSTVPYTLNRHLQNIPPNSFKT
jgi:hypothetical protein